MVKKIQALKDFKDPKDVSGVRRLLGMASYYRAFIPDFAKITAPLNMMLKKNSNFEWGFEQAQAHREILKRLGDSVLYMPLEGEDFVLETDASDKAIAAILSVRRDGQLYPVEMGSKSLSEVEQRWPVREREAWAIVWGLRHFDEYIRGRDVEVYTDHKSLEWLLKARLGKLGR